MKRIVLLLAVAISASVLAAPDESARALLDQGHVKRARAIVDARLQTNPNDAETLYLASRVKLAFGDADAALDLAEKAIALSPQTAAYHLQVARAAQTAAGRAGMFRQVSLARQLRSEAERTVELDPRDIDARMLLLILYANAPSIMGGDKEKAEQFAEQIGQVDPARGYLARARIARDTKDLTQLEPNYRKAVEANPNSFEAHTALANFYLSADHKNLEFAEHHARELIRLQPTRIGGYALLATTLATARKMPDVEKTLSDAERAVPDQLSPHFQVGRVLTEAGAHLDVAERSLRKYLTQEPEAGSPTLADCHWRLALTLEKLGRRPEAVRELQAAIKLKPDFEDAKKDLKRLETT